MTAPVAAVCASPMAPSRQETTLQPYSVRSRGEAVTVNSSATSPSTTSTVPSSASTRRAALRASTGRAMSCRASKIVTRSYPPPSAQVGRIGDGEPHSISGPRPLGIPASGADRIVVEIEAIHVDAGIRLGQSDARPAGPAGHVKDPRWRFGPKPHVDVHNPRKPFGAKQVDEPCPVGLRPALRLPWQRRRRVSNPKRLNQLWKPTTGADDVDASASLVLDIVTICQDGDVLRRQPIPASEWFGPRVVDREQLTRGVVLQPLPHVPFGGSSAYGQLRRGGRTTFCECPIQPEPFTKINGVELQCAQSIAEQPLPQCLRPVNAGHRIPGSTPPFERRRSALAHPLHLSSGRTAQASSSNRLSSHGQNPSQVEWHRSYVLM